MTHQARLFHDHPDRKQQIVVDNLYGVVQGKQGSGQLQHLEVSHTGGQYGSQNTPYAVAVALSRAMDSILTELIGCLAEQGIFDLQPDAVPAR